MMDEREIDSHNRGPLPNSLASESVTTAIDEAERQNRQQAIVMAAAAVVTSLIAAFILLQVLSGGDGTVQTGTETDSATAGSPVDGDAAMAFDGPSAGSDAGESGSAGTAAGDTSKPSDTSETPSAGATPAATPSAIDVSGYAAPLDPVGGEAMTLRAMGDISIGMSVAEAETAIGGTIIEPTNTASACAQTRIGGDPQSPVLMVVGDGAFSARKIVRIDMVSGNATRSGIGIGSPASEVLDTYGERIEATDESLTYVPGDAADADYRIVMGIVGDVVLAAHNGVVPYVNWDGCES